MSTRPAAIVALLLVSLLAASAAYGGRPAFTPSDVNKLESAEQSLAVCQEQLQAVLDGLTTPGRKGRNVDHAVVNKLEAIANKFEVVERRVEEVVGPLAERHVEEPGPMPGIRSALDRLSARAVDFSNLLGAFEELAPPDITPQLAFDVVQGLRERLRDSLVVLGLDYYRAVIPIRFVEFVDDVSQALGGDRFQYSVEVANHIFFPARLRFFVKKTLTIEDTEFTHLYMLNSAGEESTDAEGHMFGMEYHWPVDWKSSPLVWPLTYPDEPQCSFQFPPPTPQGYFAESRFDAQMRAGTYCCKEGEIVVYVNQGASNGGQYPWYTRIIGMSSYHMATRGSEAAKFVFAHELGHYFGLPHTFPAIWHFDYDYDLARIVTEPTETQPLETIRRWYEPHASLVDVETGGMAPLSMFWDMVFAPVGSTPGAPLGHLFFGSRAEAAQYEPVLQPIVEWKLNAFYFRPGYLVCGAPAATAVAGHFVGAGCLGGAWYFNDCIHPIQQYCTGDPEVRAFTQVASDPDRLRINLMNYPYPMGDGTAEPYGFIEDNFLCASQLEQIARVMNPDNDVHTRFYPDMTGMRPQLRTCEGCHSQIPGATARKREVVTEKAAKGAVLAVRPAFPNPTPHSTAVSFRLPEEGVVDLTIYDVGGRKVRAVTAGFLNAGEGKIVWDGRAENGRRVPAGTYFYRLRIDERAIGSGKVVIVD